MNSLRTGALTVNEADYALWHIITDMPKVNVILAVAAFFMNIIVPGLGTAVIGCIGDQGRISKS